MKSRIYLKKENRPVARLYFIEGNAVRITVSRDNQFGEALFAGDVLLPHDALTKDIEIEYPGDNLSIVKSPSLTLNYDSKTDILTYTRNGRSFLKQRLDPTVSGKPLVFDMETGDHEGFYGFGEWFNGFRRERDKLILYNQESPCFVQHKQTYSAFPCFLSDRGYLILILNAHRGTALINKPRGRLRIRFEGGYLDYVVISGPSWKEILQTYTRLTGRPPIPPLWCFGLWNTAYPVENQQETLQRIEEHRKREIPLDAIILDYHWEEAFHNYRWRKNIFPDPDAMIEQMRGRGVKLGLIYTPYINRKGIPLYKILVRIYVKNAPAGVPFVSEDSAEEIYQQGMRGGYFAHPSVTWWLGRGGAVDFSNPEAVNWWFAMQRPLLDQGVYFFKNDGGEYLPENSQSALGLEPEEFHNIYSFYYARATYEKSREHHGDRRALVFSRSTWAGTQRFPGIFLGDQVPKFKYLQSTMRCGLNMSLLGFAYWGADVFGLYRTPDPEIHRRYSQWTLFNPLSRYFSAPNSPERNPWGIDRSCEDNFRRHVNLRMQLLPTFYRLAYQAYRTGIPIVRPLYLEFQESEDAKGIWQQAMIGDTLMLAPVLESNATEQRIFFPDGTWYSWWDDEKFTGPGWLSVRTHEYLPLFVRGGYPLILGPVLQHIPDNHRFTELTVHLYPPFHGGTELYEDDGTTLDYQAEARSLQPLFCTFDNNSSTIHITMDPATGTFPGQPERREMTFILHDIDPAEDVSPTDAGSTGKKPGCTWTYDADLRRLTIQSEIDIRYRSGWAVSLRER